MPDRMIREGLKTSLRIGKLSERAELLFVRLILTVCPRGRTQADPETVKQVALTNRPRIRTADVAAALDELERSGLISRYPAARDGSPLLFIPRFGQEGLKTRKSPYPPPPGEDDAEDGQATLALPPAKSERKKEGENPPCPPPAGGRNSSDGTDPATEEARPRRVRRLPSLTNLRDELAEIETELTDLLYPGGCAMKVHPEGDKRVRYDQLMTRRNNLKRGIETTRQALNEGDQA